MISSRHIIVIGRVHGVGFRWSCRRQALALGVTGWVCNRSDGAVEIHAEGTADAVSAFEAWCREGPPFASVQAVDARDVPANNATAFEIRLATEP